MDTTLLQTKFARIGSRLMIAERDNRRGRVSGAISLNVRRERKGEFFEVACPPGAPGDVSVLDLRPEDRHLLLLVREGEEKNKFLCGHDERHWFVAGIPEAAPVGNVRQAKEALKPVAVQRAQAQKGLRAKARGRRKNAAYNRQGEWFFLPTADLPVADRDILRNEPLSRGAGSKPHWAEFCYRSGGEPVYVCPQHPAGVSTRIFAQILAETPGAQRWKWRQMRRNAQVFVRGRIRHADHKTIVLPAWHQVLMNTENESKAMRHVAFLD
jgi:hypothetical protein